MNESTQLHVRNQAEAPLWSIATTMILIVVAPLLLYSLAPAGPIRAGDTVFSEGQQRVSIHQLASRQEIRDEACLLDPNSPLIVVDTSMAEGLIVAEVQGVPADEWPFCPVHTEVALKPFQVFQKPGLFSAMQSVLLRFFSS
jgi:hypothetical protein